MKKYLTIILSIMMVFASVFTVFAETTANETNFKTAEEKPERGKMPENLVFGKIKSISATSVTIELATRKEMSRPENGKDNDGMRKPPEKPNNEQNSNSKPEKPNMDDMFTLTGETKTINIAQADFGKAFNRDFSKDVNSDGSNKNKTNENKTENAKTKTYQDYNVGDYVMIETTDSTNSTAKSIRDAGRMGGGPGGPRGHKGFGNKDGQSNRPTQDNQSGQDNRQAPPEF